MHIRPSPGLVSTFILTLCLVIGASALNAEQGTPQADTASG